MQVRHRVSVAKVACGVLSPRSGKHLDSGCEWLLADDGAAMLGSYRDQLQVCRGRSGYVHKVDLRTVAQELGQGGKHLLSTTGKLKMNGITNSCCLVNVAWAAHSSEVG